MHAGFGEEAGDELCWEFLRGDHGGGYGHDAVVEMGEEGFAEFFTIAIGGDDHLACGEAAFGGGDSVVVGLLLDVGDLGLIEDLAAEVEDFLGEGDKKLLGV